MINNEGTFLEEYKSEFEEYVSNVSVELEKVDSEYLEVVEENRKILRDNPKLRDLIEENIAEELSKKESELLAKYIDNTVDLKFREYQAIFFKGYKEAYYHFLNSGLIVEKK